MASKSSSVIHTLSDKSADTNHSMTDILHRTLKSKSHIDEYKMEILWINVVVAVLLHSMTIYGFYLMLSGSVFIKSIILMIFLCMCSIVGITVGAHRLWSHHSFSTRLPLEILLMVFQTLAYQKSIYKWVRDHRNHHKFTDTNGDPHNSTRGLFFSHMGWLLIRKHPDVKTKVDMKDMEGNQVVMFQKKYYYRIMVIVSIIIPTLIPCYFWYESFWYSFVVVTITRFILSLHCILLINSAAHMWGSRPYDKNISASQNILVSIFALGEGWHNYHHAFPWDYRSDEFGSSNINFGTRFIDICAKLGLAYNLKTANSYIIESRIQRTGDKNIHGSRLEHRKYA